MFKESVVVFRGLSVRAEVYLSVWADVAAAICLCGVVAIVRGAYQRGARLLGAVGPQAAHRHWLGPEARRAHEESLAAVTAARTSLGDDPFARAWAAGQAMTLDQAIAHVLEKGGA